MDNAEKLVLDGLSEITGLSADELRELRTTNLFESGILDSLSFVNLLTRIEDGCGKRFSLRTGKLGSFATVDALIAATEAL